MSTESFGALNYVTLGGYLIGTVCLGLWFSRRNRTTADYFTASQRIPWWVLGISMANVSAISYMSLPTKAFAEDWKVMLTSLPILLLAPVVAFVFLPLFRRLHSASVYEYLELRFGAGVRMYGALAFVFFQIGRVTLINFLPALALSAVTDFNIISCILVVGALSALYSVFGGIEGVIWTDFAQTLFLLGAMVFSFVLILTRLEGGWSEFLSTAVAADKFRIADLGTDYTRDVLWVVVVGSFFTQLIPYISDQSFTQRYATTKDLRNCSRALLTNGVLGMVNTISFLLVGTAIFVYYRHFPGRLANLPMADAILPYFVAKEMPVGAAGLVVAGIFAAAQSAISTGLNSTATVLITDFFQRWGRARNDAAWLRMAKLLTFAVGGLTIGLAMLLAVSGIKSAFDTYQVIIGVTASGLCGLFLPGMLSPRANRTGAIAGIVGSVVALGSVQYFTDIHFYLFSAIGVGVASIVGYLVSRLFPDIPAASQNLTIFRSKLR